MKISNLTCYICNLPAIGFSTDMREKRWYCDIHFGKMKRKVDAWLSRQELQQWSHQYWYQNIFNEPDSLASVREVFGQVELL